MAIPSSPMKIWGKSVNMFLSYDRTNKQTNRDYNFIYIDIDYTIIQLITPLEWYNENRDYNFIYIGIDYTIIQLITPLEWYNENRDYNFIYRGIDYTNTIIQLITPLHWSNIMKTEITVLYRYRLYSHTLNYPTGVI